MPPGRLRSATPWLGAAVLGIVVATYVTRPFAAAPIGYDTAASVIHFDRIASGVRLEGALSTTPKPLLTLLYGGLFAIVPDWRILSLATIVAFGLDLTLAGLLARRLAGDAAAVFVVVALADASGLVGDAVLSLGAPWAVMLVLAAGLLATGRPPRDRLAGLALAGAALVRPELLVLPAAAVGTGLVVAVAARLRPVRVAGHARGRWGLGLGLLAVPVMLVHDWLLTGNPLYWTTIATLYSEAAGRSVRGALEVVAWLLGRYAVAGGLVVLAVPGALRLVRDRQWTALAGLLTAGPGIALVLVLLAARGIFVADRYAIPIDVALTLAAAVGATTVAVRGMARIGSRWPDGWRRPATLLAVALGAFLLTSPPAVLDSTLRSTARTQRELADHEGRLLPAIRTALAAVPDAALARVGAAWPSGRQAMLIVPVPIRPRIVVELGLSLHAVGSFGAQGIDLARLAPDRPTIVYHDRLDGSAGSLAALEIDRPTTIDGRRIEPLATDEDRGFWLLRVDPAGGS